MKIIYGMENKFDMSSSAKGCLWYYVGITWVSCMFLTKYDIQYVTQKVIKGIAFSDYIAHQPVDGYQPIKFYFPDEDIMFIRV